jgi:hypothetical protein
MKRRLPIGIQDFVGIRRDGFCYVDKTARIHELITGSGKTFFLSRPRRFGKSLLCSTLGALFEGRRELFTGLAIDALPWEWKKCPVIRIDLNAGRYTEGVKHLDARLSGALVSTAESAGLSLRGGSLEEQFAFLIKDLYTQTGETVAVLVDEYDKPLLNTIENTELHTSIRSALKAFYGVLKSADAYLRFVFLTGVTKFAQISVFSDLNHLTDISLDPAFCDICGFTQEELERDFALEITGCAENSGMEREAYLERLKCFYNGYRFSRKPLTMYNSFGILHHFNRLGEFLPYWFESGTPTFLIKLLEKQRIDILHLENFTVRHEDFRKYDAATMEAVPVLYQSGYLTITGYNSERSMFTLDYPNDEVRSSFAGALVETYLHVPEQQLHSFIARFVNCIYDGDVDGIMNALKPFFASIPYGLLANRENYYEMVIHLIFTMLGLQCRSEVRIASGRIDTLVETNKFVYCFEFKLNGSAEAALAQIDRKEYLLPWQGSGKKLFKIGATFNRKKRNIGGWKTVIV